MIRDLDPTRDRAAVEDLFARAADHTALERGPTPPARMAREFLEGPPPSGADPARILRLGPVGRAGLDGIAEMAFGVPEATDVYLALLRALEARGRGAGAAMLRHLKGAARARGAAGSWWRCSAPVRRGEPSGSEGFRGVARVTDRAQGARDHDLTRMAKAL